VSTAQWLLTVNLLVGAIATPIIGRLTDSGNRTPSGTGIDIAFATSAIAGAAVLTGLVVHTIRVISARHQTTRPSIT
jgi:MFS family permease